MVTKVFSPHPALAPFVQFYLIQQTNLPEEVHCVLACKVLASIQFAFKAPAVTSFHYHGTPTENRVHLGEKPAMIGPTNVFGNAYFAGELNLLAVALQTTGTHYFIKESATAMTNRGVQVELVNKAFNEAQEKLLAVRSPQAACFCSESSIFWYSQSCGYSTTTLRISPNLPFFIIARACFTIG